ncbi:histidine kinase [Lactiplantibacillus plantarum]|nr:histidine kinase [Lactiplantibacillus plantarum]QAR75643.1 histidine kinase [Lactiplantibacillus plantarum]QAS30229.1 histidine kinase [Lactiplantibacillus plantarum]QBA76939.1 histidine kinase [Lactiplantibacillus plantarum]RWZ48411.1 histidine kinase [Lactiplantibacillus plantarum]
MLKTRMGFLMIETITALGLLMGGLIGFESLEIMVQSHERQTLQAIQTARKQYEDRQRQQLLSRIPEQAHD